MQCNTMETFDVLTDTNTYILYLQFSDSAWSFGDIFPESWTSRQGDSPEQISCNCYSLRPGNTQQRITLAVLIIRIVNHT